MLVFVLTEPWPHPHQTPLIDPTQCTTVAYITVSKSLQPGGECPLWTRPIMLKVLKKEVFKHRRNVQQFLLLAINNWPNWIVGYSYMREKNDRHLQNLTDVKYMLSFHLWIYTLNYCLTAANLCKPVKLQFHNQLLVSYRTAVWRLPVWRRTKKSCFSAFLTEYVSLKTQRKHWKSGILSFSLTNRNKTQINEQIN